MIIIITIIIIIMIVIRFERLYYRSGFGREDQL